MLALLSKGVLARSDRSSYRCGTQRGHQRQTSDHVKQPGHNESAAASRDELSQPVTIAVSEQQRVSGLLCAPPEAKVCYVLAHGAGAGMSHPFLWAAAKGLAERGI